MSSVFRRPTRILFLIVALAGLLNAGCATRPKVVAGAPAPRLIGTIVLVNDALGFALIDAGSSFGVTSEQALKSFSGGKETGVLILSHERRRPFMIADVVKGAPQKGDNVYQ